MGVEELETHGVISAVEIFAAIWLGLASASSGNMIGLGASGLLLVDGLSGGQAINELLALLK